MATPATERRLWFGILAAPTAWTVSELAGVALVGRGCGADGTLESWSWISVLATMLLAAAVAAAGGLAAYRVHRQRTGQARLTESRAVDRVDFMALAGVVISGFLLLNILFFALLPLLVEPCGRPG